MVSLADKGTPAGVILDARALEPPFHPEAVEAIGDPAVYLKETLEKLKWPLTATLRRRVWHLRPPDAPADVVERVTRHRFLASRVDGPVSSALFQVAAGMLQEQEVSGMLGAGGRNPRCRLDTPVALKEGPTSVEDLLDRVVQQVPGLVWFVTYDAEAAGRPVSVGVICPGGQYARMQLL